MEERENKNLFDWEFPILLFDEKCPLCLRFKESLDRIDNSETITKISLHNEKIYQDFPFLSKDECFESLHIITGPQSILKGPEAIKYLIKIDPRIKKFSWLMDTKIGQKTVDYFYNTANKYRESLRKRCSTCRTIRK